jgi:hypothetical protein
VAYRQLAAVILAVLCVVSVGCGGDTTGAVASAPDNGEQPPPANADQPPNNSTDKVPASADSPPSNTDTPPSNVDAPPGGGGLVDLCHKFCDSLSHAVDQCSMADMPALGELCSSQVSCQVPANYPCVDETVKVLDCLLNEIAQLCSGIASSENQQTRLCPDEVKTFTGCLDDNGVDMGGGNGDNNPPPACNTGNACTKCYCNAGSDSTKQQACLSVCANP